MGQGQHRVAGDHVCRDSNKTSLLTALASHQVEVRDGGIARDDLATLTSSLQAALETSDLVVSLVTLKFSKSWRWPSLGLRLSHLRHS